MKITRWQQVYDVVQRITYKDNYRIIVLGDGDIATLTAEFYRADIFTGEWDWGTGGTANIPLYGTMTDGDVVRAVFGLFQAIEIHECREAFKVDGSQVFGPHIELDALIDAGRHVQGQGVS